MSRSDKIQGISSERKGAYYIGGFIMLVGAVLFGSVFLSALRNFGDFTNFESDTKSMAARAIGGMALLIIGAGIRGVGARGLAGSGVVLDPEQAREDLKPYSRMAGGMVQDALDETEVSLGSNPERVIMIKCRSCKFLNEEDSKYCQECGTAM